MLQLFEDETEQLLVAERLSGKIDGAALILRRVVHQPAQRSLHDPAVDARHQAVALSRGQERSGRYQEAFVVDHAQQDFTVTLVGVGALQGFDGLPMETKPTVVERPVDAGYPIHFAGAADGFAVGGVEDLYAVAAFVLCGVAGCIGCRQEACAIEALASDLDQADAGAHQEGLVVPGKAEVSHGFENPLGDLPTLVGGTVLQQDAKFVATEACKSVRFAHAGEHERGDLAQHLVAGSVTTGVIDDLELIQVDVEQYVMLSGGRVLDEDLQPTLELGTVVKARQRIVGRGPAHLPGHFVRFGDIVEYQHDADDRSLTVTNRRRRVFDVELGAVAADQHCVVRQTDNGAGAQNNADRIVDHLPRAFVDDAEHVIQGFAGCLGIGPAA